MANLMLMLLSRTDYRRYMKCVDNLIFNVYQKTPAANADNFLIYNKSTGTIDEVDT